MFSPSSYFTSRMIGDGAPIHVSMLIGPMPIIPSTVVLPSACEYSAEAEQRPPLAPPLLFEEPMLGRPLTISLVY